MTSSNTALSRLKQNQVKGAKRAIWMSYTGLVDEADKQRFRDELRRGAIDEERKARPEQEKLFWIGAKLKVESSLEGLNLKEFFLLLSSTGLAYRRCELIWINGEQIGITFNKKGDRTRASRPNAVAPSIRNDAIIYGSIKTV